MLSWRHLLRVFVGRFLTHFVLVAAVVLVPALRVLCYGACVPQASPHARPMVENVVTSDATRACHERNRSPHPSHEPTSDPLQDDCTHGGEASLSSLSASAKSFGDTGPRGPAISTVVATDFSIVSSDIRRDTPSIPSTGQRLGLFLTPLRI